MGDIKQVPKWESTNIRCHHKKFSHHGDQGLCTSGLDFTSYCLWSLQGPFQFACSGPSVPIALSPSSLWSGHCPCWYYFTFFPNLDHVWQQQQVPPNCWQPPIWCHKLEATQIPWIVKIPMLKASHCLDYCWFPSSPNCFSQVKVMRWFHFHLQNGWTVWRKLKVVRCRGKCNSLRRWGEGWSIRLLSMALIQKTTF